MRESVAILSLLIYNIFLDAGCVYLYGWQQWSGWWFVFAACCCGGFGAWVFKILGIKDDDE
jgi:hypothetical protein